MTDRAWILKRRPVRGELFAAMALEPVSVPDPAAGEVQIETIYISLDPANRLWMEDKATYIPPLPVGEPMKGTVLGRVCRSGSDAFQRGDLVIAFAPWASRSNLLAAQASKVTEQPGIRLHSWLGALGVVGWTAYFGVKSVAQARSGETMVVSGAAGAVGSLAGQIGKALGLRVIGIAGNRDKCAWLVDELGFDAAINYRDEDIAERLAALAPARSPLAGGVDIYFENVGGAVGNAVYSQMADNGRVALCGLISQYSTNFAAGGSDLSSILMRRVTLKGFIVSDYVDHAGEAISAMSDWIATGRIQEAVDIIDGIEAVQDGFARLFTSGGDHRGKLIARLSPSPTPLTGPVPEPHGDHP